MISLHLMLCVATAMTDIYACAENTPVMTTFMHADAAYEIRYCIYTVVPVHHRTV